MPQHDDVDDVPVLPSWIGGHAYLTLPPAFHVVRNAEGGKALRRTPLCGAGEVQLAVAAAQAALPAWQALAVGERAALLVALADALAGYADHFAALLREEGGFEPAGADVEVAAAIAVLRAPAPAVGIGIAGVAGVVATPQNPFQAPLALAAPALLAGATVVVRPAPRLPSALLACAELTARCGFPAGVFNVVHGGEEVLAALRATCAQHLACA